MDLFVRSNFILNMSQTPPSEASQSTIYPKLLKYSMSHMTEPDTMRHTVSLTEHMYRLVYYGDRRAVWRAEVLLLESLEPTPNPNLSNVQDTSDSKNLFTYSIRELTKVLSLFSVSCSTLNNPT